MISASWQRCVAQHRLSRDASRPIIRLQSSELLPRRQSFVDQLSGNLSEIQWLSDMSRRAGHFAVVADEECVLVMHDLGQLAGTDFERAGIVDGGCWTEQIAATNGVAMALRHRRTMTVTGAEHYYALLTRFMCTASPIFDHEDNQIGAINVSALDRGDMRDRSFAEHILRMATSRIQARLFHEHFSDHVRTVVASSENSALQENWNALLAIDSDGVVRGATRAAARELGFESSLPLVGRKLETILGTSVDRLVGSRGQPLQVDGTTRPMTLTPSLPKPRKLALYGQSMAVDAATRPSKRITLADFEGEDEDQRLLFRRARLLFRSGLPLFVIGGTGVGKRAFAHALHFDAAMAQSPLITLDPAELGNDGIAARVAHLLEHARAFGQAGADMPQATLYLKEPGKLPTAVQYQVADFLADLESAEADDTVGNRLRVVATSSDAATTELLPALQSHLAAETIYLAPIAQRRDLKAIIERMRDRIDERQRPIAPAALDQLCRHDWPGNFRELKLVLRRAVLIAADHEIGLHDLPDNLFTNISSRSPRPAGKTDETELSLLRNALASTNWNMSEAARRCGISRATIHRRVKELGIVRPRQGRLAALEASKSSG